MDIETGLVKPRDLIVSLRAELAAEREKVRELEDTLSNAVSADFHNERLAASQLSEQRLREALDIAWDHLLVHWTEAQMTTVRPLNKITEAIATPTPTPTDTSALDAYVAEKVEPWEKDAERYRWLTYAGWIDGTIMESHGIREGISETLDAAIDTAIAAQEPKA